MFFYLAFPLMIGAQGLISTSHPLTLTHPKLSSLFLLLLFFSPAFLLLQPQSLCISILYLSDFLCTLFVVIFCVLCLFVHLFSVHSNHLFHYFLDMSSCYSEQVSNFKERHYFLPYFISQINKSFADAFLSSSSIIDQSSLQMLTEIYNYKYSKREKKS